MFDPYAFFYELKLRNPFTVTAEIVYSLTDNPKLQEMLKNPDLVLVCN